MDKDYTRSILRAGKMNNRALRVLLGEGKQNLFIIVFVAKFRSALMLSCNLV